MIVVAIIGILAAIAIPQYQKYAARSQVTAALSEISPGKTQFELALSEGTTADINGKPAAIGLKSSTKNCSSISVTASGTTGNISCVLAGSATITGATLKIERGVDTADASGNSTNVAGWNCTVTNAGTSAVTSSIAPKGCTVS